jgi:D-serine deaminase-like pyridoxal phosphate-dependent protein
VTVLASVVSSRSDDRTSVVDAGALALSADPGPPNVTLATKGEILTDGLRDTLRQNARIVSLSQEHGVVSSALPVGSRIRIIPNHSCLSVACFDAFFVVRGDEVLDRWTIHRGR